MPKPKLVVLSGAGISAESGLRTFRDGDGLWEDHRIEDVATPDAWLRNRELVLRFYNERRKQVLNAEPNEAHKILAELENDFEVQIITQNIDDLHERAGSTKVLHLHGEIFKMRSEKHWHDDRLALPIKEDIILGNLADDGGQYRPHIVWFGEAVPAMDLAVPLVQSADLFLVVGTSLVVYPAAGLVDFVQPGVPIYAVDKSIPAFRRSGIIAIEKPATQGMKDVAEMLKLAS